MADAELPHRGFDPTGTKPIERPRAAMVDVADAFDRDPGRGDLTRPEGQRHDRNTGHQERKPVDGFVQHVRSSWSRPRAATRSVES